MKPTSISKRPILQSHHTNTRNIMTLTSSPKRRRETILLYGAWTMLILSLVTMVLPASNPQTSSNAQPIEAAEFNTNSQISPSN